MSHHDVFNGDADGILSLHQLRLAFPRESVLITGVKRDIKLLEQIPSGENSSITVLDISMESNAQALDRLLAEGAEIEWFDHHRAGEIPATSSLKSHINLSSDACTGLIVNEHLEGRFYLWAVAAAFGDNLSAQARALGSSLSEEQLTQLKEIGEALNYNGYGQKAEDLSVWPGDVYLDLQKYTDPFEYYEKSACLHKIIAQKTADEKEMGNAKEIYRSSAGVCVLLPKSPASARMSGVFSNEMVMNEPDLAHAIFTQLDEEHYRISIRAPLNRPEGADVLAVKHPTGGGRSKAGGVNSLPMKDRDLFFRNFDEVFSC
ncbi:MAG: acetyltransferase [Planctomycetes bacterium]|nr:acetyltransferase [Planctomycetota bacterium]